MSFEQIPQSEEQDQKVEVVIEVDPQNEINNKEKLYRKLEEECEEIPELKTLFKSFQVAALRYLGTVNTHEHMSFRSRASGFDPVVLDRLESAGVRRTYAHNSLIDAINALSRQYKEQDLDNSWRSVIGLEREQIGYMGIQMARVIRNDKLKEEAINKHNE